MTRKPTGSARFNRTLLTVAVLALTGIALYAMAGFWIAPRVLERKLQNLVREGTDPDFAITIEAVSVNPFTLALSLDNVTLFRPQSTPVGRIDRVEGRLGGVNFGERSLIVHDFVMRSLEVPGVADREHVLEVPLLTAPALTLGRDLRSSSIDSPRMERPTLRLYRGPGRRPGPPALGWLIARAGTDSAASLTVDDGTVVFTDLSPATPLRLEADDVAGSIARRRSGENVLATASLRGRLAGEGTAELAAEWLPARPREQLRLELDVHRLPLAAISPYVTETLGQAPVAGWTNMDMELSIDASNDGSMEPTIGIDTGFVVGNLQLERSGSGDRQESAIDTAVALLESDDGLIAFRLPVTAHWPDVGAAFSAALADYLARLAATPFDYLAELVGRPGMALGQLSFPPGSAEIGGDTTEKIAALGEALELRPKLGITVFPALDPDADRAALAGQQMRLHVNLASSAGLPGGPAAPDVDFHDPIVRSVLEEFTANRLPESRQAALAERWPEKDTPYYRAVFDALVDNESVAAPVLQRLARYRARSVVEALSGPGDRPNDQPKRVRAADEIVSAETAGPAGVRVPLEVRSNAL